MLTQLLSRQRFAIIAGIVLAILIIVGYENHNSPLRSLLDRLDHVIYDLRFDFLQIPKDEAGHNIVIIDIDEHSLESIGRWPWSRQTIAQMVENLYNAGVVVLGFDVVFSEPEINIVESFLDQELENTDEGAPLSNNEGLRAWMAERAAVYDNDQRLAEAVGQDTVLGMFLHNVDGISAGRLPPPALTLDGDLQSHLVTHHMRNYTANLPKIQGDLSTAGVLTTIPDSDGVIRRSPMVFRYGDGLYLSLSMALASQYLFVDQPRLDLAKQGQAYVMEGIWLDRQFIPTDERGNALVPFIGGPKSFTYVPAGAAVQNDLDGYELEGAIAIVGTSAFGLGDLKTTVKSAQYPGVEVHANLVRAILLSDGEQSVFPKRSDIATNLNSIALILVALILSLWLPRLGPLSLAGVSYLLVVIIVGSNIALWHYYFVDAPMAALLMLAGVLASLNFALSMLRESMARRQIKEMFGQYVPRAHIDKMLEKGDGVNFEGESKEMTVLFSDIRSFTTISEGLSAAKLKNMLNEFFTPITRIIFEHDGTIDKYVGDMVMTFWGAPLEDAKHASHAVDAALEMLKEVERLKPQFQEAGLPSIDIGIGINTGLMNVGDMGSSYRRAYTVLGDAVNLGSRLEGVTKFYGVKLLVGETTYSQAPEFLYRSIDRIQVKGKTEPIDVFEPIARLNDASEQQQADVQRFNEAIDLYRQQHWDEAQGIIRRLDEAQPSKVYQLYLERIEDLRSQNLPSGWDGVFTHTSK